MKKLKIIQTSDLHGYLFNNNYVKQSEIGFLNIKNYIQEERKKDQQIFLIDTGDVIQGSAFDYYVQKENLIKEGHPIINELSLINYDLVTFGNHEFNYGLKYLEQSFSKFQGDILVANICGIDQVSEKIKPYQIYEIEGLKIGVIGLVTAYIENFEKPENIKGLKFKSAVETYLFYEEELKEKSDLIIVNYHGGFEGELKIPAAHQSLENEGLELLEKTDSIDLLLTGHQHRVINEKVGTTICMQPGSYGSYISEIEIDLEEKKIVNHELKKNNELKANLNSKFSPSTLEIEKKTQHFLEEKIGVLSEAIPIESVFQVRKNGHPLLNLINQIQLEISGADVSATSLFDSAIGFNKEVTMRNVLANYPFSNSLVVLEVSEEVLKEAMEISASYFTRTDNQITVSEKFTKPKAENYNYDIFWGINYEIDTEKPVGKRVTINSYAKEVDKKAIKLVINDYRYSNHAWYPMYQAQKVIGKYPEDIIGLITEYIKSKERIQIKAERNFIVK